MLRYIENTSFVLFSNYIENDAKGSMWDIIQFLEWNRKCILINEQQHDCMLSLFYYPSEIRSNQHEKLAEVQFVVSPR